MMNEPKVSNPNDFKVVSFHNTTAFDFTPDLGCMYDGQPINGNSGAPGIQAGEKKVVPYHVGRQLAINLAKRVLNTSQSAVQDTPGVPTGVPIWSKELLEEKATSFLTELYSEAKPIQQTEAQMLLAKVEEYKNMVDKLIDKSVPVAETKVETVEKMEEKTESQPKVFLDKKEVIDELTKRGIKFDARKNKADLEKLLA